MFSAGKERAKNVNVDFLSSRMRARKNKVAEWIDSMSPEKHEQVVMWSIGRAKKK